MARLGFLDFMLRNFITRICRSTLNQSSKLRTQNKLHCVYFILWELNVAVNEA